MAYRDGTDGGSPGRFDPRFDPAFQPGYDAHDDPVSAARGRSVEQPRPGTGAGADPRPGAAQPPAVVAPAVRDLSVEDEEVEADDPPLGRNPFIIALWVLSVIFVLGGLALVQSLPLLNRAAQSGVGVDSIYLYLQAALFGAPMLIALGFATACAVLMLHAARWPRR